jgi:hypothetical protein
LSESGHDQSLSSYCGKRESYSDSKVGYWQLQVDC